MNPNATPSPGFELPAPVGGDNTPKNEQPAAPEFAPNPGSTAPASPQPAPQLPQQPTPTPQALQQPAPAAAQMPLDADDTELIEKEWVEKAKAIVASTRHDPRAQNRELNKFKADYMQKRYNKTIKIDES